MDESYLKQISRIKKEIDRAIKKFISHKKHEYSYCGETQRKAIDRLGEFATRGKSIRGTLFVYTAERLGFQDKDRLLNFAVAMEIAHSALLIHDDIMDDDLFRRGKPSIHAQYINDIKKSVKDNEVQTAKSIAISVGDMAFFMAFQLFNSAVSGLKNGEHIIKKLLNDYSQTGLGQIDDVFFGASNIEPNSSNILKIYLYKTARYTFSMPLVMASLFNDSSTKVTSDFDRIGEDIGIVFQIVDDEIGIFGEKKEIGKTAGIDISRNTKNLIRYFLYKKIPKSKKKILDSIFGKDNLSVDDLGKIRSLFREFGVKTEIDKIKEKYIKKANNRIKNLATGEDIKNSLVELLVYVTNRKS